eukprot:47724-Pelagomonas_calceolata.AAC.2
MELQMRESPKTISLRGMIRRIDGREQDKHSCKHKGVDLIYEHISNISLSYRGCLQHYQGRHIFAETGLSVSKGAQQREHLCMRWRRVPANGGPILGPSIA